MNKKLIVIGSIIAIVAPMISFAQVSQSSCAMPTSANASLGDWTSVIICLQNRIMSLENRVSALESQTVSYPTTPISPAYPTTPILPATPTITIPVGQTNSTIGGQNQSSVGSSIQATPTISASTIQQGASSDSVKAVQTLLQSAGVFNTAPTGYFGTITKSAVQQFQSAQGIPATGIVDQTTLQKMKAIAPQLAPSVSPTIQAITVPNK